ncbi:hypothetical protein GCM10010365_71940 [Streptomyces poonensis]|uniref:Winged helix-turn-helix domain-containing protein n=2 Tax=Streptomyces poonensis TaxID=68255 RepID=A0A918QCC0_9ACTN|nr:hypothetical protein GCM10010365_71940 [Streptomyces poonensis]GLJ91725.1 hypothetical protein GCM10017589_43320 [Streptomyces poonensis]
MWHAEPTAGVIGRTRELTQVERLLRRRARVVTVTGPPGAGKSTVAAVAASRPGRDVYVERFRPSWEEIQDPEVVPHVVADALRTPDDCTLSRLEMLLDTLEGRSLLLVLHDCDHLIGGVTELVNAVVGHCREVDFLVSARQPLHVPGEQIVVLPPLAPAAALALFTAVARETAPPLPQTEHDQALVAEVCELLDRLPLAVELAARSLSDMSLEQLAELVRTRCLTLGAYLPLTNGRPLHHVTLANAISWSHELCTPPQRLLWARLSAFDGGFGTAEAVARCADELLPPATVADGAAQLLDRSLLLADRPGAGQARYRMPRTIRAYGATMLRYLGEAG